MEKRSRIYLIIFNLFIFTFSLYSSDIERKENLFFSLRFPSRIPEKDINALFKPLLMAEPLERLQEIAFYFPYICNFSPCISDMLCVKVTTLVSLDSFLFNCVMKYGWYRWHPDNLGRIVFEIQSVMNLFKERGVKDPTLQAEHVLDASGHLIMKGKKIFKLFPFLRQASPEQITAYLENPQGYSLTIFKNNSERSTKRKAHKEKRKGVAKRYQELRKIKKIKKNEERQIKNNLEFWQERLGKDSS